MISSPSEDSKVQVAFSELAQKAQRLMPRGLANVTWRQELRIWGRATDETRKTGWVHIVEVFEWQVEKIVFYSVSDEDILKVKAG